MWEELFVAQIHVHGLTNIYSCFFFRITHMIKHNHNEYYWHWLARGLHCDAHDCLTPGVATLHIPPPGLTTTFSRQNPRSNIMIRFHWYDIWYDTFVHSDALDMTFLFEWPVHVRAPASPTTGQILESVDAPLSPPRKGHYRGKPVCMYRFNVMMMCESD